MGGDDLRRADDAQRGIAPDAHVLGQESIFESSLIPSPLGRTGDYDPYNNALVYFLAMLSLAQVLFWPIPMGPLCIIVAGYRVHRRRPHAKRGFGVAIVATALGLIPIAALAFSN